MNLTRRQPTKFNPAFTQGIREKFLAEPTLAEGLGKQYIPVDGRSVHAKAFPTEQDYERFLEALYFDV